MDGVFWLAWPWMGIGGAAVMAVLLFATDFLRSDPHVSRWRDPAWLAWVLPPLLMVHQFEEYACHVVDGQYALISTMGAMVEQFNVPLAHFPLMNMVFAWVALPLAAIVAKRNPVVGLSGYGFVLANAFTHIGASVAMGISPLDNPGFFTGVFAFVGLNIWVAYICIGTSGIGLKGWTIMLLGGILGHVTLFLVYALGAVAGPAGILVGDVVTSFAPMLWALLGCKLFLKHMEVEKN